MQDRDTLMAIAQIAATFVGFAGVVFAVKRASVSGVSDRERNAITNLLIPSTAVLFAAFIPLVATTAGGGETGVWRVPMGFSAQSIQYFPRARAALQCGSNCWSLSHSASSYSGVGLSRFWRTWQSCWALPSLSRQLLSSQG